MYLPKRKNLFQYADASLVGIPPQKEIPNVVISSSAPTTAIERGVYSGHIASMSLVSFRATAGGIYYERRLLTELPTVWSISRRKPALYWWWRGIDGIPEIFVNNASVAVMQLRHTLHVDLLTSTWSWSTVTWNTKPPTQSLLSNTIYFSIVGSLLGKYPVGEWDARLSHLLPHTARILTSWGNSINPASIYGISVRQTVSVNDVESVYAYWIPLGDRESLHEWPLVPMFPDVVI